MPVELAVFKFRIYRPFACSYMGMYLVCKQNLCKDEPICINGHLYKCIYAVINRQELDKCTYVQMYVYSTIR